MRPGAAGRAARRRVCLLTYMARAQGIEQVAGTVADQAQPVAQCTAKCVY